jgi:predicted MFS family arabinose efflux permease
LLVPLGDRFDRRRLILIQLAALTLSLAAAALAPDAWSLVVASALVGGASSVAQQIVPFAAELAAPSRRGATIGIVMSGLLCGILFGRALAGAVGDHYGWRGMQPMAQGTSNPHNVRKSLRKTGKRRRI